MDLLTFAAAPSQRLKQTKRFFKKKAKYPVKSSSLYKIFFVISEQMFTWRSFNQVKKFRWRLKKTKTKKTKTNKQKKTLLG